MFFLKKPSLVLKNGLSVLVYARILILSIFSIRSKNKQYLSILSCLSDLFYKSLNKYFREQTVYLSSGSTLERSSMFLASSMNKLSLKPGS